jgi:hypothetical protein
MHVSKPLDDSTIYTRLMLNHGAIVVIVLVSMHLVYHLASALMGYQLMLSTILFPHGFEANPRYGTWSQNRFSIVYTYAAGPVLCLVLAAFAKMAHSLYYCRQRGDFRIFLYWIYLVGANYFFGGALIGLVTNRGFGHAILYGSNMPIPWRIGFTFASMLILIIIGTRSLRYFLEFSPSEDLVIFDNKKTRLTYLFVVVAMPWLIGSTTLLAFMMPSPHMVWSSLLITLLLCLFPILSFFNMSVRFFLKPEPETVKIKWPYIFAALALVLIARLALIGGIGFIQA